MTSESLIQVIQSMESLDFVRDLAPRHIAKLASMSSKATFREGETIFREGDEGDVVYLIQEGRVALEIGIPGRGKAFILTVGPGELLGWSSMFPGRRRTAGARTVAPTQAIVIDAEQLWEACEADHDLGYAIMWRVAEVISERLDATRLQLLDMFGSDDPGWYSPEEMVAAKG